MTFEDFCKNFVNIAICRVVNTSIFSIRKTWSEGCADGMWAKPARCGGCINNRETFLNNPQVIFLFLFDSDKSEGSAYQDVTFLFCLDSDFLQLKIHRDSQLRFSF